MSWTLYPPKKGDPNSPSLKVWVSSQQDLREMVVMSEDSDGVIDRYRYKSPAKKAKPVKEKTGRSGPKIDKDFVGLV